ncbi:MAG TPA: hypothetical protein H9947_06070 [Candidatus Evtepia excrementipullorum]|nr:hypothetical protein [Candidatus Evtepia excrementipullorum]
MIAITPPLRRGLFLLVVGLLVLDGCLAFPLVNLTHPEYDGALWDIILPSWVYLSAGVLARMLLGPRCLGKMLGLVLPATAAGFLCRYGLEYGETSIAYAFSLPNCAFHLAAAAGLTLLGACLAHFLRRR